MRRFKTLPKSFEATEKIIGRQVIFGHARAASGALREIWARVFLNRPRRSRFLKSVRFQNRDAHTDRMRCVRQRRFPSDRQAVAHSFVRTAVPCLNFLNAMLLVERRGNKRATGIFCRSGRPPADRLEQRRSVDELADLMSRSGSRGPIDEEVVDCCEWSWQKGGFPCASVSLA